MGRLIINVATTVNGAYEAPVPAPDGWLVLDPDSVAASLAMWEAADAMVLGRATYEGLAAVWPQMTEVPGMEAYAVRMNGMPKYVASRTLTGELPWNATAVTLDDLAALKEQHAGDLVVSGVGQLGTDLMRAGLVDELLLTVSPALWGEGPRLFDTLDAVPLELIASTTYSSGVVTLRYRVNPSEPGRPS